MCIQPVATKNEVDHSYMWTERWGPMIRWPRMIYAVTWMPNSKEFIIIEGLKFTILVRTLHDSIQVRAECHSSLPLVRHCASVDHLCVIHLFMA